ncbi:MAG TPA: AAA family ATPase [Chloroflexota bacterium]
MPDIERHSRTAAGDVAWHGFELRKWLAIFHRRWRVMGVVGAVVFALTVVVCLILPQQYTATMTVLVAAHDQRDLAAPTNEVQGPPSTIDTDAVDTRADILQSPQLALEVVKRLGLVNDPEFNRRLRRMVGPMAVLRTLKRMVLPPDPYDLTPAAIQQDVLIAVMKATDVKRSGLTYDIDLSFSSQDRDKAARIANAFGDQYIRDQLGAASAQARRAQADIDPNLAALTQQVQAADNAVQDYKIKHSLMDANGATMAEQAVSNYDQQIALAKADWAQKEGAYQSALAQVRKGGGGADVSAALSSDTIRNLRTEEADASRNLAQLTAHYGDRYPDVVKARQQLADIEARIQDELTRILSGLQSDASTSGQRVASLEGSQHVASGSLAANNAAQTGLLELQRRADALQMVYDTFLNASKESSAEAQVVQPDSRIVSRAEAPHKPSFPNWILVLPFGVLAGGLVALMTVGGLELLRDGLETVTDLEERLNVASAGIIPQLSSVARTGGRRSAPYRYLPEHPFSTFAEAFRSLRTYLMMPGGGDRPPYIIAVTSALPGEGKSVTAFGLAQTLALAGTRTLLIDCDLRRRGVTTMLGGSGPGVVELLTGDGVQLGDVMRHDERSGLTVIRASRGAEAPADFFTSPLIDALVAQLDSHFDVVVIDTPPVLAIADARVLCAKADATLLLTRWRKTPFRASLSAIDLLAESGANVVGVALTQVNMKRIIEGSYGDRYAYSKLVRGYYID